MKVSEPSPQSTFTELEALLAEVSAVHHRLEAVAQTLHRQGDQSRTRRGVLRELERAGARTVPQLARQRGMTRQHLQVVVNALLADGLVEPARNPEHRRSNLIQLTTAGRTRVAELVGREMELLAGNQLPLPADQLAIARELLRSVRLHLEGLATGLVTPAESTSSTSIRKRKPTASPRSRPPAAGGHLRHASPPVRLTKPAPRPAPVPTAEELPVTLL